MRLISLSLLAAATLATTACSPLRLSQPPDMKLEYPEVLVVLTRDHTLLTVQASRPDHVLDKHTLTGLREGDRILGIDYRPKIDILPALLSRRERPWAIGPFSDGDSYGVLQSIHLEESLRLVPASSEMHA